MANDLEAGNRLELDWRGSVTHAPRTSVDAPAGAGEVKKAEFSSALASGILFLCYVIRGSPPLATGLGDCNG